MYKHVTQKCDEKAGAQRVAREVGKYCSNSGNSEIVKIVKIQCKE